SSPPPRPRRPARLGGRVAMRGAAGPGEAEQAHQKMVRAEASEVLAIRGTAEEGLRSLGWSFASLPKQAGAAVRSRGPWGGWWPMRFIPAAGPRSWACRSGTAWP
ncbi:unnamed protein product, partial [Prorocentrum cordatum]